MKQTSKSNEDGQMVIYRASITLKNGKKLYAWEKGLKAFRIVIRPKNGTNKKP